MCSDHLLDEESRYPAQTKPGMFQCFCLIRMRLKNSFPPKASLLSDLYVDYCYEISFISYAIFTLDQNSFVFPRLLLLCATLAMRDATMMASTVRKRL